MTPSSNPSTLTTRPGFPLERGRAPRHRHARALGAGVLLLGLVLASLPGLAAESARTSDTHAPTAEARFVFGVSPFLDRTAKDPSFRALVGFLLEDAPRGSSFAVYDAYHLRTVTQTEIPRLAAFGSAKTRATQFRQVIADLKRFLASEPEKPESRGLDFTGALRLPQFLDFLGRNTAVHDTNLPWVVTLLGSPLYLDAQEPGFSMAHGYFPSDGHLLASRDKSLFGIAGKEHAIEGVRVHWNYFGEPWASDLHREKVSRFWTHFIQGQGGNLGTLSGDLPTTFAALRLGSPNPPPNLAPLDATSTKIEMLRISRDVGSTDWITQDRPANTAEGPPAHTVGPLKIGIRWKGDIDLDLYARARPEAARLYFENPRAPEGYYYKDHRSSPDREYEFIEFLEPVDVRAVQAEINFYEGNTPAGPGGEIRVEFDGRVHTAPFSLPARSGNQGREGRSQSEAWFPIDLPKILRLR
ncbi:MAG: hypothetical protein JNL97_05745 [Verrucomicrobiales bacterium]|nr:hypothetical protein [Verrucomicrobiales bacterium]